MEKSTSNTWDSSCLEDLSLFDMNEAMLDNDFNMDDYINHPLDTPPCSQPTSEESAVKAKQKEERAIRRFYDRSKKTCMFSGCGQSCSSGSNFWRHFRGTHIPVSTPTVIRCAICDVTCKRSDAMRAHKKSKAHIRAVAAMTLKAWTFLSFCVLFFVYLFIRGVVWRMDSVLRSVCFDPYGVMAS